jgi:hypothetical protein
VSAWYLLWMLVTVLGIFALLFVGIPISVLLSIESEERASFRHAAWRGERRRRREIELYGELLGPCLYCGSECEFGPNCANRHLSPMARAQRRNARLLDEMPHLRERAASAMAALVPADPVMLLPCPCARCGKTATLLRAFQNAAGHVFCGYDCYRAGGET